MQEAADRALDESHVRRTISPLYRAIGWMRFYAVVTIVLGLLGLLLETLKKVSGIDILFLLISVVQAVVFAWLGFIIWCAASHVQAAHSQESARHLRSTLSELAMYFRVSGVAIFVWIVLALFAFALAGGGADTKHGRTRLAWRQAPWLSGNQHAGRGDERRVALRTRGRMRGEFSGSEVASAAQVIDVGRK